MAPRKPVDLLALNSENLSLMIEVGRFCGWAATASNPAEVQKTFGLLVKDVAKRIKREEKIMKDHDLVSKGHKIMHKVILKELTKLHNFLKKTGNGLDKQQLLLLRQMFAVEGDRDAALGVQLAKKQRAK